MNSPFFKSLILDPLVLKLTHGQSRLPSIEMHSINKIHYRLPVSVVGLLFVLIDHHLELRNKPLEEALFIYAIDIPMVDIRLFLDLREKAEPVVDYLWILGHRTLFIQRWNIYRFYGRMALEKV